MAVGFFTFFGVDVNMQGETKRGIEGTQQSGLLPASEGCNEQGQTTIYGI